MIEVLNRQRSYRVNLDKVRALLAALVAGYRLENKDVTLALVDTKMIKALNRRFLNRPGTTDVLSFPGEGRGADGRSHLGDIIICVPQAFRQCFREPHGLETEIHDLTIHGFLHLAGFDHGKGIEAEEVKARRELVTG
jgi:probable rRNA maturation factor